VSEVRVLIVDDSSVMRKIVERSLRQAGLESLVAYEASNGADALEALKNGSVDLILTDINMPSMDGLEFLSRLRSQNLAPGVPVVLITTEGSLDRVKQGIEAGAQHFIHKPFSVEQLRDRVLPLLKTAWLQLLSQIRLLSIASSHRCGVKTMGCTVPQSLRDTHPGICDPKNLDAAVEDVFSMMLGVDCKRMADVSDAESEAEQGTVTAVIGLGGVLSGACIFRCSAPAAIKLVGCMTGMNFSQVDRIVEDGIGEICNMVAGAWRNRMPELAAQCGLSVPAVVSGCGYNLHLQAFEFQLQSAYGFEEVRFSVTIACGGLQQSKPRKK
jgi:CheY-like chemotaxis protein